MPEPYFYPGPKRIAAALKLAGFTDDELVTMVAIHGQETSGNVWVRGGPNTNGSYDYGAFQINVPAGRPEPSNWMNYFENAKWAREIYLRQGYKAWYGYSKGRLDNKAGFTKNKSWTWREWAQDGVNRMNAEIAKGYALHRIASAYFLED